MYAIQNIKTGKFVYGTDYRYPKPNKKWNQRTSHNQMLTYADYEAAKSDFRARGCGKDYRIVVLKTIEVKKVIERSESEWKRYVYFLLKQQKALREKNVNYMLIST